MDFIAIDMNWTVIIIVGIAAIVLLIFINRRNQKDRKDMEQTMNQVEEKPSEHDTDNESKV
jgi:FtsZ-interacting cell division protein ZipA